MSNSVWQKRQRVAMALIVSPQTGQRFESPQADIGCSTSGAFSCEGACSHPYVPQPPTSAQHSRWWICSHLGQTTVNSSPAIGDWQIGHVAPASPGPSRRDESTVAPTVKAMPFLQIGQRNFRFRSPSGKRTPAPHEQVTIFGMDASL